MVRGGAVLQPGPETLSRPVPTDPKLAGAISFSVFNGLRRTRITSFLSESPSSAVPPLHARPQRYCFASLGPSGRIRHVSLPIKSILLIFRNRPLIPFESNARNECMAGTRCDWRKHVWRTPTAQEFRRWPLPRCFFRFASATADKMYTSSCTGFCERHSGRTTNYFPSEIVRQARYRFDGNSGGFSGGRRGAQGP